MIIEMINKRNILMDHINNIRQKFLSGLHFKTSRRGA